MKVKLNPMFEQARGQLGELIFREIRGETVASRKPTVSGEPTVGQTAHRDRFKQATAFGKSVMADSSLRALYQEVAKSRDIPIFALTVADFFNAPVIDNVNVLAYHGQAGDLITISARDDFEVLSVHVSILDRDNGGSLVESGNAVETAAGSGQWIYTATAAVTAGTELDVKVVATDRPGGTGLSTKVKFL